MDKINNIFLISVFIITIFMLLIMAIPFNKKELKIKKNSFRKFKIDIIRIIKHSKIKGLIILSLFIVTQTISIIYFAPFFYTKIRIIFNIEYDPNSLFYTVSNFSSIMICYIITFMLTMQVFNFIYCGVKTIFEFIKSEQN